MPASAEPHSKERTLVAVAAVQDFNYKIALASGLRELQAGRLRQAEQQFGYLCSKFPAAPGGYRGLAKVRIEQADRPGALAALRDGAAKLAKAGQHAGVVGLLNEALQGEGLSCTVDFCKTDKGVLEKYASYVLEDCMVSGYSVRSGGDRPTETLTLNFTKVEYGFIGMNDKNESSETPKLTYDIAQAKLV